MTVVFTTIALIYTACVLVVLAFAQPSPSSALDLLPMAMRGGAILNVVLLFILHFGWRWIWRFIPKLNDWVFPDLNGEWDVELKWVWGGKSGALTGEAEIKQSLLTFSMELKTDRSASETLLAKPKRNAESGRPLIYYIYRNTPKMTTATSEQPHDGAAVLNVGLEGAGVLSGNYFTNRETKGHLKLSKRV